MTRRDYIPYETRLAAALGQLSGFTHLERRSMTAAQMISLHQRHHAIEHAITQCDEHWNIDWMLRPGHKRITPANNKAVKKSTRISAETLEFRRRILAVKTGQGDAPTKPRSKMRSRPFPKGHRPMVSGRKLPSRKMRKSAGSTRR